MDLPRNIQPVPSRKGYGYFEAYNVRNQFRKYFCSREEQVAWQLAHVERVNWKKRKLKTLTIVNITSVKHSLLVCVANILNIKTT